LWSIPFSNLHCPMVYPPMQAVLRILFCSQQRSSEFLWSCHPHLSAIRSLFLILGVLQCLPGLSSAGASVCAGPTVHPVADFIAFRVLLRLLRPVRDSALKSCYSGGVYLPFFFRFLDQISRLCSILTVDYLRITVIFSSHFLCVLCWEYDTNCLSICQGFTQLFWNYHYYQIIMHDSVFWKPLLQRFCQLTGLNYNAAHWTNLFGLPFSAMWEVMHWPELMEVFLSAGCTEGCTDRHIGNSL